MWHLRCLEARERNRGDRDRKLRMGCQERAAFRAAGQHQLFTGDCPQISRGAATVLKGTSNLQDSCAPRRACQSELGPRLQVLQPEIHMDFPPALRSAKPSPALDVGRALTAPTAQSGSWFTCLPASCLSCSPCTCQSPESGLTLWVTA